MDPGTRIEANQMVVVLPFAAGLRLPARWSSATARHSAASQDWGAATGSRLWRHAGGAGGSALVLRVERLGDGLLQREGLACRPRPREGRGP